MAASDEGVAFRYRFTETDNYRFTAFESELSSFTIPQMHAVDAAVSAAGPPRQLRRLLFSGLAGRSAAGFARKGRGRGFSRAFNVSDASTWALLPKRERGGGGE